MLKSPLTIFAWFDAID